MDVQTYLSRIHLTPNDLGPGPLSPSEAERLQRAHVTAVPFETFSVAGGPFGRLQPSSDRVRVLLDLPALYQKIVEEGRGGICYELNVLFRWLLTELGAEVDRLAARVVSPENSSLGPSGDH